MYLTLVEKQNIKVVLLGIQSMHGMVFESFSFFASCLQLEEISNALHKLFDDKTGK